MNLKEMIDKKESKIPLMGMGTFGSDKYTEDVVANAVATALKVGYRLFDCASVYGNEKEIGEVFNRAIADGVIKREELFVMSKVWNDMHGDNKIIESCIKSLSDLKLSYIDLYFIHWPFPNYHAKGCSVDSRNPDSKPFFVKDFLDCWRQMEYLKEKGLVKEIAVSNMTIPKLKAVLPLCKIKPYAHEMEIHPTFQQKKLYQFCIDNDIITIGYCPLGSPNRPLRDRTPEDIADTELPEITNIAAAHGWSTAKVCLVWALQNGHIPIPFATKEENIKSNYRCLTDMPLTDAEMEIINGLDKDNRLVKGHVFLWNGAETWQELWDIDDLLVDWKLVGKRWTKPKS